MIRLPAGTCSAGAALKMFESEDSCSFPVLGLASKLDEVNSRM